MTAERLGRTKAGGAGQLADPGEGSGGAISLPVVQHRGW